MPQAGRLPTGQVAWAAYGCIFHTQNVLSHGLTAVPAAGGGRQAGASTRGAPAPPPPPRMRQTEDVKDGGLLLAQVGTGMRDQGFGGG